MKKFSILPLIAALMFFVSCKKEQAVERPVQTAEEKQRSEARQKGPGGESRGDPGGLNCHAGCVTGA